MLKLRCSAEEWKYQPQTLEGKRTWVLTFNRNNSHSGKLYILTLQAGKRQNKLGFHFKVVYKKKQNMHIICHLKTINWHYYHRPQNIRSKLTKNNPYAKIFFNKIQRACLSLHPFHGYNWLKMWPIILFKKIT